ncbi:hypothetical protein [Solimicrobium silvestre]|uniref:Tetratricopeptide repeat n=1 Tax=Solimicrobium silvestre TaxID=2099400 RepID=A0A2S9H0M1_9BURK|nr:hypothetical protein [Solimicrobium silvestre]PRC93503.1 hypothetical protein S2091_1890 [Solimicrobium silvestre]
MKLFSFKPNLLVGVLCAVSCLICQNTIAAVNLNATIKTQNIKNKPDSKTPADTQESLDVTLDSGYMSMRSANEIKIFDFKTRRRFTLDDATKTYMDYSIYDTVGFRDLEFQNRENLNKRLAAAKIDVDTHRTIDNEHLFAVQSQTQRHVEEKDVGDDLEFSIEGRELARWSKAGVKVSAEDSSRFVNFLRYKLGGHPQILKRLAASGVIPNKIVLTFNEFWGTTTCTIVVNSAHQIDDVAYDLSAFSRRQAAKSSDKLDQILGQDRGITAAKLEHAKNGILTQQASDIRDGKLLDAMLAVFEFSLTTGQQIPPFTPDQLAKIRLDSSVQNLTHALGASTKEAMPDAITTLVNLRLNAPNKAYILKIFEANDRLKLGDSDAAKALFAEVLQTNPYIAGVYKDLGDLFYMRFDTAHAWQCWDIGRQIAPEFTNLKAVSQYEDLLTTQHSEYF